MTSTNNLNELSTTDNTRKYSTSTRQLSIDEIRSRLNAATTGNPSTVHIPTQDRSGASASGVTNQMHVKSRGDQHHIDDQSERDVNSNNNIRGDTPEHTLLQIAEAMLGHCQLLVESQRRSMNETRQFRETEKHLNKSLGDGDARFLRHNDTLEHLPKVLRLLDSQYYQLKDKAKVLIRECQEDREKNQQECEAALTRLQDLESELFSSQSIYHQQSTEIQHLQEATRNLKSQSEVSQLRNRLHKLEQQNRDLEKENKAVQNQVLEIHKEYERLLSDGNEGMDNTSLRNKGQATLTADSGSLRDRTKELRELVNSLRSQAQSEHSQFEQILEGQRQDNEKLKSEAHQLLDQIERR